MALIKIESGEVVRHVGQNGAFALQEWVTLPDGRTFPKTFTVWATGLAPEIGSLVKVTGEMSTKLRTYGDNGEKTAIDVSINNPEIETLAEVSKKQTMPLTAEQEEDAEVPF